MEIDVGGIKFKGGKMFVVATAITTAIGVLYGGFEIYKDYMDMKSQIQNYVAPDLSKYDERLSVIEETTNSTNDYVRDIKNDLKADIRKVEGIVESVERDTKDRQREMEKDLRELRTEVDSKIKRALDNPLSNPASMN